MGGPSLIEQQNRVLATPITVKNIDTFYQTATDQLIELADLALLQDSDLFRVGPVPTNRLEDASFKHFKLKPIPELLDALSGLNQELLAIDQQIAVATQTTQVFVPPQKRNKPIIPGKTRFQRATTQPRIKAILFTLQNQLGITGIQIIYGTVTPEMMRQTPYTLINIPSHSRSIIVCDEKDNATFVFDTQRHKSEELIHKTKPELEQLIAAEPTTGIRINFHYSTYLTRIAQNVTQTITNKPAKPASQATIGSTLKKQLLPPQAGEKTAKGLAEYLRTTYNTKLDQKTITNLANNNEIRGQKRKWKNGLGIYYSTNEQVQLETLAKDKGLLAPAIQDGELTLLQANMYLMEMHQTTLGKPSIIRAVQLAKIKLLDRKTRRGRVEVLTSESLSELESYLLKHTRLLTPNLKIGEKTANQIANYLRIRYDISISRETITGCCTDLGVEGWGRKINGKYGIGYNPQERVQIVRTLRKAGKLVPKPKAGEKNADQIARDLGREFKTTIGRPSVTESARNVKVTGVKRKALHTIGTFYTSEERLSIENDLEERGLLAPTIKNGEFTPWQAAKHLSEKHETKLATGTVNEYAPLAGVEFQPRKSGSVLCQILTKEGLSKLESYLLEETDLLSPVRSEGDRNPEQVAAYFNAKYGTRLKDSTIPRLASRAGVEGARTKGDELTSTYYTEDQVNQMDLKLRAERNLPRR